MREESKIRENLLQFLAIKGENKSDFYKKSKLSNGFIDKLGSTLNIKSEQKIRTAYPELNISWLLTGEGQMLKEDNNQEVIPQAIDIETFPETKEKGIPLYDGLAVGGLGGFTFALSESNIKDYYVIPKFKDKNVDFMIEITGSSMYPKYNSGDVIACTIINESQFIQWNKVHCVATKYQGILVKRIKQSTNKDCLTLVSDNKDYDPFDVPKDEILGLALVVGVVRLE